MSNNKEYYHNKGEEDAKEGKYDRPHGVADSLTTWSSSEMQRHIDENEAYDKGYSHAKGQKDKNENRYNPPSDSDDRSAYDSGYSSTDSSSSSCFITTATLTSLGKPDNCDELNTFRNFRDNWLAKQPDGQTLILEYYNIAPQIVKAINQQDYSHNIYSNLWRLEIEPCLRFIENRDYEKAKLSYCKVVAELKAKFLD